MQKGWYHIVNERKTSVFSNGLLWFGAGISIAEILTGMLLAPLGFAKAFAAIILGHLIGGTVMYLAGLIGGRTGGSAMETVRISFGTQGAKLFAGLNVIQLVGWTAVMVASAASQYHCRYRRVLVEPHHRSLHRLVDRHGPEEPE